MYYNFNHNRLNNHSKGVAGKMFYNTKPKSGRNPGFTIVELLIVIVVIGILATISIVAYNNVQQNSRKARLASDISNIKKAMAMFKSETGNFPACPSGPECMYLPDIKPQLEAQHISGLSTYNFNYVVSGQRWALLYRASTSPYQLPQSCKLGTDMVSTWYSGAPEC